MPSFIALGCLEVGEKFTVCGWVGSFPYQLQSYTNLKLGWFEVMLCLGIVYSTGNYERNIAIYRQICYATTKGRNGVRATQHTVKQTSTLIKNKNFKINFKLLT